ncbi:CatB-related O-acetyltransferase [uncultured Rhodospira sp.]|uniref:CatB-related O-acetyltransferase n=1 Tax=uncultured Rhodospira sp. TaxID=1936189 RepID=UPI002617AEF3|nr:CatB-related O-acetyltransferase [uncultured Rhodospira sp.]
MPVTPSLPPDPDRLHPIDRRAGVVFLRPLLAAHPPAEGAGPTEVGAYSYYHDFEDPTRFFSRNVRYHFPFSPERLVIGKFCALAHGTTFVMASAAHTMAGPSTYPFPIMGGAWAEAMPLADVPFPNKGDTVIGNDVWLGYESLILPGVTVGDGAVVAARAVVHDSVPPYAVVAGNPSRVIRFRFEPAIVSRLLDLAWWTWPANRVIAAIPTLVDGDLDALERLAP